MTPPKGEEVRTASRAKKTPVKASGSNSRTKTNSGNLRAKKGSEKLFGEFLFEIGCEEIPAGMIAKSANDIQVLLSKYLYAVGLIAEIPSSTYVESFGAPRRLVAIA